MITVSEDQLKRAERMLKGVQDGMPKAVSSAINRAADASRTEIVRIISRTYFVKAEDVRNSIKIRGASLQRLDAEIKSRGKAIPLDRFRVSGNPMKRLRKFPQASKPVTVQVRRDSQGQGSSKTFAARARKKLGGRFGLYQRKGSDRYPIKSLWGPPFPIMIGEKRNFAQINARAQEILDKRFDHEIARLLKGFEGKRR
jgi:hypothetical protein